MNTGTTFFNVSHNNAILASAIRKNNKIEIHHLETSLHGTSHDIAKISDKINNLCDTLNLHNSFCKNVEFSKKNNIIYIYCNGKKSGHIYINDYLCILHIDMWIKWENYFGIFKALKKKINADSEFLTKEPVFYCDFFRFFGRIFGINR